MTSLKEKIENDPVSFLFKSVMAAVISTGVIVSAGWAYWGKSGVESENNLLTVQLKAERDRFSQCQANLDELSSKEIKCTNDLAVQIAKIGSEKESCNNRVEDQQYRLKTSNARNRLLNNKLSSVNSSLKEQVTELEKEKKRLEREKVKLDEVISSYNDRYNASIEMEKIDDQYKQIIKKLDVAFSEYKENQEKISIYNQNCNSIPSINYQVSCQSLKEAILKKEAYELQIVGYQKQLDNFQKRMLVLNKKMTDI